ncbi:MAG: restriction endonuclease subunit S [Bacteroidales bacterium]|nr:restriction endonuclease subunit S [Bacteroidales bacterium]
MEEWKEYKATDFCHKVTDGTHDSPKPKSEGHYLITSKHLKDNNIDFLSANRISDEDYQKVIMRSAVEKYDILFSMIGTIGNVVQIRIEDVDFAVKNMGIFKMGRNQLRSSWLYYWLKSPYSKEYINQRLAGSTQSYLTLNSLREFPILYPNDSLAEKIVEILKALDDKIECNRRINENLEQQAQALFKSWFVDFEPFKDGEFVESELGPIPKGWRVISLNDIIEVSKTSINPQKKPTTLFSHYSIPAFDNGMQPEYQTGIEILSNKFVINNKMTLLSKLNPRIKRIWYIDGIDENSICSTEFVPYRAKNDNLTSYVYCILNNQQFYDFILSMVNGATGSHQRFHPSDSLSYLIPFNEQIAMKFNRIINPILSKNIENRSESSRLAELRDALLPRLMSGELKVGDVEV